MKKGRTILRILFLGGITTGLVCVYLNSFNRLPALPPAINPSGASHPPVPILGTPADFTAPKVPFESPQPLLPMAGNPGKWKDPQPAPVEPPQTDRFQGPSTDRNLAVIQNKTQSTGRFKTFPSVFKEQEGSSANFISLFGDDPFGVDLRSDWMTSSFFPGRDLPVLRMKLIQDPNTGTYRLSGGGIELPGNGLEAGYETDPGTDDYKATLQWKKSF